MWDFTTLKNNIFKNLSSDNKQEFQRLIRQKSKDITAGRESVIIGLPIQNGNTILFGCTLSGHYSNLKNIKKNRVINQIHPFVLKPKNMSIYPKNIKGGTLTTYKIELEGIQV